MLLLRLHNALKHIALLVASASPVAALAFGLASSPDTAVQQRLSTPAETNDHQLFQVGHFTKVKQDNITCPSYGESQWTGLVTVSPGHSLFYWYFDSRNDPENDPVILWANGGPGGSSMVGMTTELGPCFLGAGADQPVPNPWSWNNNASIIFLDQPAGSGLSKLAKGLPLPKSEHDTAPDFESFLVTFFNDIFPEKKHLPLHIAMESYGGHYIPMYMDHILDSRRHRPHTAFWGHIKSLILVDALFDWVGAYMGVWDTVCRHREQVGWFNASTCASVLDHMPEQRRLGAKCTSTYDPDDCQESYEYGQKYMYAPMWDLVAAGKIYMGNIKKKCAPSPNYPFCIDPDIGNVTAYFNQDRVKAAVGKKNDKSFIFHDINMDIHLAFRQNGSWALPLTRQLGRVLDAYDDLPDLRVLVLNGNEDFFVNTAGMQWSYDRLKWSGLEDYRNKDWRSFILQHDDGVNITSGYWKTTSDARLAFVGVDDAGHMVPADAREGSSRILNEWLTNGWRM